MKRRRHCHSGDMDLNNGYLKCRSLRMRREAYVHSRVTVIGEVVTNVLGPGHESSASSCSSRKPSSWKNLARSNSRTDPIVAWRWILCPIDCGFVHHGTWSRDRGPLTFAGRSIPINVCFFLVHEHGLCCRAAPC